MNDKCNPLEVTIPGAPASTSVSLTYPGDVDEQVGTGPAYVGMDAGSGGWLSPPEVLFWQFPSPRSTPGASADPVAPVFVRMDGCRDDQDTGFRGLVPFSCGDVDDLWLLAYAFTADDGDVHAFPGTWTLAAPPACVRVDVGLGEVTCPPEILAAASPDGGSLVEPSSVSTAAAEESPEFTVTAADPYLSGAPDYVGVLTFGRSDGPTGFMDAKSGHSFRDPLTAAATAASPNGPPPPRRVAAPSRTESGPAVAPEPAPSQAVPNPLPLPTSASPDPPDKAAKPTSQEPPKPPDRTRLVDAYFVNYKDRAPFNPFLD